MKNLNIIKCKRCQIQVHTGWSIYQILLRLYLPTAVDSTLKNIIAILSSNGIFLVRALKP